MASNLNQLYQQQIPDAIRRVQSSAGNDVNRYMGSLMGGQKSLLDDYVKRAAGAGIRRGGMNVAGASPLEGSLALAATRGLASQYATNYNQAVNYANADLSRNQQLLSQLMSGVNASGGYDPAETSSQQLNRQNGRLSGPALQARVGKEAAYDRRTARIQAEQDRKWVLEQRNWLKQDRVQQLRDKATARMRDEASQQQARLDQAERFKNQSLYGGKRDLLPHLVLGSRQQTGGTTAVDQSGRPKSGTTTALPNQLTQPQAPKDKKQAEFQAQYQKQQMLNQLEREKQQIRLNRLQTESQELQLSGDRYKQDAWMRAQNPYLQSINAFLGLGGLGYGGMNNARMGQARTAADVWAGLTKMSNRSFSWNNSNGASRSSSSYKG